MAVPTRARTTCDLLNSGVLTTDTAIKESTGNVYWLTVSDTVAAVVGLANSTTNSTTYLWKVTIPSDGYGHFIFDPPIEFSTGIWLDIPTGTPDVIVGYK